MPDPLRWFREWRSPRLICERTGEHAWRTATRRGSEVPHAKLTEAQVAVIKQTIRNLGFIPGNTTPLPQGTATELAQRFGVGISTIYRIKTDRAWRHVPWPES